MYLSWLYFLTLQNCLYIMTTITDCTYWLSLLNVLTDFTYCLLSIPTDCTYRLYSLTTYPVHTYIDCTNGLYLLTLHNDCTYWVHLLNVITECTYWLNLLSILTYFLYLLWFCKENILTWLPTYLIIQNGKVFYHAPTNPHLENSSLSPIPCLEILTLWLLTSYEVL